MRGTVGKGEEIGGVGWMWGGGGLIVKGVGAKKGGDYN